MATTRRLSQHRTIKKGDHAERLAIMALRTRFPQYDWQNLNDTVAHAPFDLLACEPDTGQVVMAVEVKGTDFKGSSPGITMRKDAMTRKRDWLASEPITPVMACVDWRTGQTVCQVGIRCYHVSEMTPVEEFEVTRSD